MLQRSHPPRQTCVASPMCRLSEQQRTRCTETFSDFQNVVPKRPSVPRELSTTLLHRVSESANFRPGIQADESVAFAHRICDMPPSKVISTACTDGLQRPWKVEVDLRCSPNRAHSKSREYRRFNGAKRIPSPEGQRSSCQHSTRFRGSLGSPRCTAHFPDRRTRPPQAHGHRCPHAHPQGR